MDDIWGYILNLVECDKDKCRLLMTCSWISKCKFYFNKMVAPYKIINSRWFNHFVNIHIYSNYDAMLPSSVTHLQIDSGFTKLDKNYIPSTVSHLRFGDVFNQSVEGYIPTSVTHVAFGTSYNQPIKDCIPSSVTELTLGDHFNQPLHDIPSSITKIIFRISVRLSSCEFDDIP